MTTLAVNPTGIPNEIKLLVRWVVWRNELRNGNPTKVPYRADGRAHAEANNAATWGSFDAALSTYQAGGFDGIGVMLGDGLAGIDLDSCRNPDTGAIDAWAQVHIDRFPSYAEVSPTGTGVKLLVRGQFPTEKTGGKTGKRNKPNGTSYCGKEPGIEAYHRGRYFAITGHPIEGAIQTISQFNGELGEWFLATFEQAPRPAMPEATNGGQTADDPAKVVECARAYIAKIEPAISGQRGSDATFRVACVLRCDFGLSIEDSLAAIVDWNARCQPPWSEHELRHKLEDAGREPVTNRLRERYRSGFTQAAWNNAAQARESAAGAREIAALVRNEELQIVNLASVQAKDVVWRWPGRIPSGMMSLLVAQPEAGKTAVACDVTARITRGMEWPDGSGRRETRAGLVALN